MDNIPHIDTTTSIEKFPYEMYLIDSCKHCFDAYGLWIQCDASGELVEHYNIVFANCSKKEKRETNE